MTIIMHEELRARRWRVEEDSEVFELWVVDRLAGVDVNRGLISARTGFGEQIVPICWTYSKEKLSCFILISGL